MKTKDKILQSSLEQYNKEGYNNVTTRDIAKTIGISSGNLHYHFKHSNEIVQQLFEQFASKMNLLLLKVIETETKSILDLYNYIFSTANLFYEYKFIFLNFIDILRENPEINSSYLEIHKRRKVEFEKLFKNLKENRVFKKDIPDFIYDSIIEQMFIIGDNCIVYNDITKRLEKEEAIQYYTFLFMNQFYYLMTEENQKIYQSEFISSKLNLIDIKNNQ